MPNIWTHIMFAEDTIEGIKPPSSYDSVINYLNLGAQGPDPFFYHNFWPWRKNETVNEIGNSLHVEQCGPFLLTLIKKAHQLSIQTKAYVLGFVTHHILDRNTHPFIHFFSGYEKNKHQELEVIIDTIMMERFRNIKTWKTPVYQEIDVGFSLNEEIETLLTEAISTFFPDQADQVPSTFVQDAYKDMKQALHILYDPYGWKNTLLGKQVSPFSHQPLKTVHDYLNLNKQTWYHSATKEVQEASFLDLYEEARREGLEICTEVLNYWEQPTKDGEERLQVMLDNISYDTGKPVNLQLTNQYSDPIV